MSIVRSDTSQLASGGSTGIGIESDDKAADFVTPRSHDQLIRLSATATVNFTALILRLLGNDCFYIMTILAL